MSEFVDPEDVLVPPVADAVIGEPPVEVAGTLVGNIPAVEVDGTCVFPPWLPDALEVDGVLLLAAPHAVSNGPLSAPSASVAPARSSVRLVTRASASFLTGPISGSGPSIVAMAHTPFRTLRDRLRFW